MSSNSPTFSDYSRISDTLMFLDKNIMLTFVTSLSKSKAGSNKQFFHSENKYNGQWSIKRQMSFYFCLSESKNFTNSIVLRPQDVALFLLSFEKQVLPWYVGNKRIFSIIDSKLAIKGEYKDFLYTQSDYVYIKICPIVYTYEDGQSKEGARLYLNADDVYSDMDLDKLMGFYYLLKNTDMYTVASTMANYVKTPPYGVNVYNPSGLGSMTDQARIDVWSDDPSEDQKHVTKNTSKNRNEFLNNLKVKKSNTENDS